jgi:hypothetical protein
MHLRVLEQAGLVVSQVWESWEIEPVPGGFSKLTLVQDGLDASPKTANNVRGWSYILSNLKTVLETGEPLPPIS